MRDARAGRADHFGQCFVTQRGYGSIRRDFVLAKAGQFQENSGQPLLAVIEKLFSRSSVTYGSMGGTLTFAAFFTAGIKAIIIQVES